jgi:hypothetical protein
MDDAGLNDWLELQKQVNMHDGQMKELVASHVEDLQRSVQAEASHGTWDPQEKGSNKHANKMVISYHGSAYSPKNEYGLGIKNMMASMTI